MKALQFGRSKIFSIAYNLTPKPINVATHQVSAEILKLEHHPFHERLSRRLESFDPDKLHILVATSYGLSKSAYIRGYTVKRARSILFDTLRKHGWNWDGTARAVATEKESKGRTYNLRGAWRVLLPNDPIVLTSSADEVREECERLVQRMAFHCRPSTPSGRHATGGTGRQSTARSAADRIQRHSTVRPATDQTQGRFIARPATGETQRQSTAKSVINKSQGRPAVKPTTDKTQLRSTAKSVTEKFRRRSPVKPATDKTQRRFTVKSVTDRTQKRSTTGA